MAHSVEHNREAHRFELNLDDGGVAYIEYSEDGDRALNMRHTEVPESAQGKGVGADLVRGALDMARADGYKVVPTCPFVAKFIQRNPEYSDSTGSG